MYTPFKQDEGLNRAYLAADTELRVRHTRVGAMLALILVPAGSSLEYFIYPEHLWDFFIIRLICDSILLPLYLILYTSFAHRYIRWLSALWAITPALAISAMIYRSEGSLSPYYAGLNLMIIVTCQLLPYTFKEATLYCIAVLSSYILACVLHTPTDLDASIFYNNIYFIVLTSIISVTASYYYNIRRIEDFQLRHELDEKNQELTKLDQLKSQFFANISHELRTPLTLILAPLQDLLQTPATLSDQTAALLRTARDNALRLLKLVNDLLEVIRLEEGKMNLDFRPIEINGFVSGITDSMLHLAGTRELTVDKRLHERPMIVWADPHALERVFLNLLSNAFKFTPQGGSVAVATTEQTGQAIVEVSDTGIGIAENELPYVFDRFRQADGSATRKYQGTGLGLALVKELTEKMAGQIRVASQVNEGTTMRISMPLYTEDCVPEAADEQPNEPTDTDPFKILHSAAEYSAVLPADVPYMIQEPGPASGPTVLVVDDEPDMRYYLVCALEQDYRVLQARDGRTGLELARQYQPELILLDLMLPEMDGLEVCKQLKEDPTTRFIKIMLLTARVDEQAKITALEYGADDFLTKPFSRVEVQTRLRNLLQTARLEKDLSQRNQKLEQTLKELQQTQARLLQSEKINALGKLAAGLLHEINNPLNYSLTALQLAGEDPAVQEDEDLHELIADIHEGMERIRTIVSDLRAFAYPSEAEKQAPFSFAAAVESALRFTAHELRDVQVEKSLARDDRVLGSQTHIVQVLVNLLTNAVQAIEPLHTERTGKINLHSERRQQRLHVRVQDNGVGIDKEVLARVFDPFFTTRDVGQGMGLGLSICHTIIQNHGATLEVQSEEGRGTEFSFDLPLADLKGTEQTRDPQKGSLEQSDISVN